MLRSMTFALLLFFGACATDPKSTPSTVDDDILGIAEDSAVDLRARFEWNHSYRSELRQKKKKIILAWVDKKFEAGEYLEALALIDQYFPDLVISGMLKDAVKEGLKIAPIFGVF